MNTTITESKSGTVGEATQEMTSPTVTSTFTTPTMTFGEVGTTAEHEVPGYEMSVAHGVGQMDNTSLLERMVLVTNVDWTLTTAPGTIYLGDIDRYLRAYVRNWATLRQFQLYRADYEITVRLNTNQFYYGALMVNLFPGDIIGQSVDELSVLQPTIISASCADSVVASLEYPFPFAWKSTTDNTHPVYLSIRSLTKLYAGTFGIPDAISVQIWARFKNIVLSYPRLLSATPPEGVSAREEKKYEAQSAPGSLKIKRPKKGLSNHPLDSVESGIGEVANALTSVASGTIDGLASMVSGGISDALGLISILDKPDKTVSQTPMIIEGSSDAFVSDVEDTNVCVSLYKDRYVDPGISRMPMSSAWTVSRYAQIPGIRAVWDIVEETGPFELPIFCPMVSNTQLRTPLDWAYANSTYWRGSIKLMIQFFTSSFVSARFALQYINELEFPGFETDYSNGISRVIDVKGDTIEMITLPWLSQNWWTARKLPRIQVKAISNFAGTTGVEDVHITAVVWVAGGDDIQFAFPRIPLPTEWRWRPPLGSSAVTETYEPQTSIQELFAGKFPPIAEDCVYDIDQGLCTAETLGLVTDICKRYSWMQPVDDFDPQFIDGGMLDNFFPNGLANVQYGAWRSFSSTYFGLWRSAFLYRSGGYRWRQYPPTTRLWEIQSSTTNATWGTYYNPPFDDVKRLTIPQVMPNAYGMIGVPNGQVSIVRKDITETEPVFIAARDDLQFGYPILPQGIPIGTIPLTDTKSRGLRKVKG